MFLTSLLLRREADAADEKNDPSVGYINSTQTVVTPSGSYGDSSEVYRAAS